MLGQQERAQRFAEVINLTAANVCEKMDKQISQFKKDELARLNREAQQVFEDKLKFEKDRISSETNKQLSDFEMQSKRTLSKMREKITDSVFEKAAQKLEGFTKSEQYDAFLKRSISALSNEIEDAVIFVKESDAERVRALFGGNICVKTSDKIRLGGAFAQSADGAVTADDTLDIRLEEKREWFLSESGLVIK